MKYLRKLFVTNVIRGVDKKLTAGIALNVGYAGAEQLNTIIIEKPGISSYFVGNAYRLK